MKIISFLMILLFSSTLFAQSKEVNILLEKVNHSKNSNERKELIELLKIKLAKVNKQAYEESNAIIKAREKMPLSIYTENLLKK